ncbi:hypothetical protein [Cyanobium sp. ATX 6F1]|uniref:hypothetical protein n=1 Tax=unclassified Cyanobium TaxID=2627006 RepID=UPI0020CBE2FA|nr:hypothetical protein [Cyanobium sp. ATX 6F1]MCP9915236.1 hypothetical protein [Cyanobium sp. ATX 6F1]
MTTDQPTRALLHKVVTTAEGPFGTSYTVAYFEDREGDKLLAFATSDHFGDLDLLPLMTGQELALAPGSACLEVLPLKVQSEEVQHQVAEQRSLLLLQQFMRTGH